MIGQGGPMEWGRSNPFYPQFLFGATAIGLLGTAVGTGGISLLLGGALLVGGMLLWTLLEYIFHRFLFHVIGGFPGEDHLRHHDLPRDIDKVAAPMTLSYPVFLLIAGAIWIASGTFEIAAFFGSGICIGYMIYEWIHYSTHNRIPRTRLGKYYRRYHMIHHFKDTGNYFGMTSPFWDWVFRTKPVMEGPEERSSSPQLSES